MTSAVWYKPIYFGVTIKSIKSLVNNTELDLSFLSKLQVSLPTCCMMYDLYYSGMMIEIALEWLLLLLRQIAFIWTIYKEMNALMNSLIKHWTNAWVLEGLSPSLTLSHSSFFRFTEHKCRIPPARYLWTWHVICSWLNCFLYLC